MEWTCPTRTSSARVTMTSTTSRARNGARSRLERRPDSRDPSHIPHSTTHRLRIQCTVTPAPPRHALDWLTTPHTRLHRTHTPTLPSPSQPQTAASPRRLRAHPRPGLRLPSRRGPVTCAPHMSRDPSRYAPRALPPPTLAPPVARAAAREPRAARPPAPSIAFLSLVLSFPLLAPPQRIAP